MGRQAQVEDWPQGATIEEERLSAPAFLTLIPLNSIYHKGASRLGNAKEKLKEKRKVRLWSTHLSSVGKAPPQVRGEHRTSLLCDCQPDR